MKILVTGAKGFVGKNLCATLKTKEHTVYEYDVDTSEELLQEYCRDCEFVFYLAGVNRPKDVKEFLIGNYSSVDKVLNVDPGCLFVLVALLRVLLASFVPRPPTKATTCPVA